MTALAFVATAVASWSIGAIMGFVLVCAANAIPDDKGDS